MKTYASQESIFIFIKWLGEARRGCRRDVIVHHTDVDLTVVKTAKTNCNIGMMDSNLIQTSFNYDYDVKNERNFL